MRRTKSLFTATLAVALTVLANTGTAAAEGDKPLPVPWSLGAGVAAQLAAPNTPPPGANDWSCKPSDEHPNPVVLTHGLLANQTVNWQTFSPLLHNEGYCVFTLTYGMTAEPPVYQPGGLTPMEPSAKELDAFVDKVLAATGSSKVDILGHSEGTLMPGHYVQFLGGASKVDKYVSLTPLWRGTSPLALASLYNYATALGIKPLVDGALDPLCASCTQFLYGSDFLDKLHRSGTFAPEVTYTNIATRYDELIVPYTSGLADAPNVNNIVLQDQCPLDLSEHAGVAGDPVAAGHVLNALDPENPRPVPCVPVTPAGGVDPNLLR